MNLATKRHKIHKSFLCLFVAFFAFLWLFPFPAIQNQSEMRRLDATFSRGAHDVVKHGRKLENLEAALAQVSITADVTVPEPKHVPELMCERPPGQIARRESYISAHQTMCGLRASREHCAVFGESSRMCTDVDALAPLSDGRHFANLERQQVRQIAIPNLPQFLD